MPFLKGRREKCFNFAKGHSVAALGLHGDWLLWLAFDVKTGDGFCVHGVAGEGASTVYDNLTSGTLSVGKTYHGVFATHPENDKRLKEVVKQNEIFTNEASKEDRLFSFLNGLVYGDSSREGVRRGNNFYHADLWIFL